MFRGDLGQFLDFLIRQEVDNCTSIARYELGDSLDDIKGKLIDLPAADKSFLETQALCNKTSAEVDKLNEAGAVAIVGPFASGIALATTQAGHQLLAAGCRG